MWPFKNQNTHRKTRADRRAEKLETGLAPRREERVDFDRDMILLGDPNDLTSLMMTLTMKTRGVFMNYDSSDNVWVLKVDWNDSSSSSYTGPTERAVLTEAMLESR